MVSHSGCSPCKYITGTIRWSCIKKSPSNDNKWAQVRDIALITTSAASCGLHQRLDALQHSRLRLERRRQRLLRLHLRLQHLMFGVYGLGLLRSCASARVTAAADVWGLEPVHFGNPTPRPPAAPTSATPAAPCYQRNACVTHLRHLTTLHLTIQIPPTSANLKP